MTQRIEVVLIEDNPADADLMREAFCACAERVRVQVVEDGDAACALVARCDASPGQVRPDLILLDWQLPPESGEAVLRAFRSSAALARVPVVVLSSSSAARDVRAAYAAGASCYVTKPVDLHHYLETMNALCRFWLGAVLFPER